MNTALRSIARTITINLTAVGLLGAVAMGSLASEDKEAVFRPTVVNANDLIEQHGCANQGDPTHAVITVDGVTRYVGRRLTDKAIEQAVFGVEHGMVVHSFCE